MRFGIACSFLKLLHFQLKMDEVYSETSRINHARIFESLF